jgi:hypothetical protein
MAVGPATGRVQPRRNVIRRNGRVPDRTHLGPLRASGSAFLGPFAQSARACLGGTRSGLGVELGDKAGERGIGKRFSHSRRLECREYRPGRGALQASHFTSDTRRLAPRNIHVPSGPAQALAVTESADLRHRARIISQLTTRPDSAIFRWDTEFLLRTVIRGGHVVVPGRTRPAGTCSTGPVTPRAALAGRIQRSAAGRPDASDMAVSPARRQSARTIG